MESKLGAANSPSTPTTTSTLWTLQCVCGGGGDSEYVSLVERTNRKSYFLLKFLESSWCAPVHPTSSSPYLWDLDERPFVMATANLSSMDNELDV